MRRGGVSAQKMQGATLAPRKNRTPGGTTQDWSTRFTCRAASSRGSSSSRAQADARGCDRAVWSFIRDGSVRRLRRIRVHPQHTPNPAPRVRVVVALSVVDGERLLAHGPRCCILLIRGGRPGRPRPVAHRQMGRSPYREHGRGCSPGPRWVLRNPKPGRLSYGTGSIEDRRRVEVV